ncbi:hypothetical protein ABPG74_002878 [Tetrahymena malaccensis]
MSNNMNQEKERIKELEKKADELQQQQKLGDTLNVLEEVLNMKREVYGEDSEQYQKTSEKLCEICNIIAMICLNKDKNDSCYDFLKKAEILCQGSALYKAITYNNMAQYCKKTNKIKAGIIYLQKAQEIQLKQGNPVLLADTHLNLCALLSNVDRHNEALEHILIAVVLLQDEYNSYLLKKVQANKQNQEGQESAQEVSDDLFTKLSIAYHNMGVEFEFLKRYEESLQTYEKAVNFAKTNLGPEHELCKQFTQVFQSAQQSIADIKHKEINRKKPSNLKLSQLNTAYNTSQENYYPTTTKKQNTSRQGAQNVFSQTSKAGSQTHYGFGSQNMKNKRQDSQTELLNNKIKNSQATTLPQINQSRQAQKQDNSQHENKQAYSQHQSMNSIKNESLNQNHNQSNQEKKEEEQVINSNSQNQEIK